MITFDGLEIHNSEPLLKIHAVHNSMVLEIYEQFKPIKSYEGSIVSRRYVYKLHIYSRRCEKEYWKEFSSIRSLFYFVNHNKLITAKPSIRCWQLLMKSQKDSSNVDKVKQ